jgi:tRNA dimethylallyltransferase
VYKGLNLGTGKITKREMCAVSHHLLDILSPKKVFSVSDYQKKARGALEEIVSRGKVPIVVGGTGFYIDALVYATTLPEVPPNPALRKKLSEKNADELFLELTQRDRQRGNTIDPSNKVRLIRALEIIEALGKVPHVKKKSPYNVLWIGLMIPEEKLKVRIEKRLIERIKKGMVDEVRELHASGLSWKRLEQLGLEYRFVSRFLRGKLTKKEMITELNTAIWQYAKRQKTWFAKNKKINWFPPSQVKKIEAAVKKFLK